MDSDEPPKRALDRLADLTSPRYHRLGGGLKRRIALIVVVLFFLVLFGLSVSGSKDGVSWGVSEQGGRSGANSGSVGSVVQAFSDSVCFAPAADTGGVTWDEDGLMEMVARTNGYYARDWSLGLGWSQMRFIIQTALLHASLLNRTLILPSYVYGRSCEWEESVCSAFADHVNREGSLGWSGQTGNSGWRIPIHVMLDLPHLRRTQPVILASEFYALHGLSPSVESHSGIFNRDILLRSTSLSVHTIANSDYDSHVLRVDRLTKKPEPWRGGTEFGEKVRARMLERMQVGGAMDLDDAKIQLSGGPIDVRKEDELMRALHGAGMDIVYSFKGVLGMDFVKSVTSPTESVVFTSALHGFVEDFSTIKADVLHLEGEIHLNRKSGGLRFTTPEARDHYMMKAVYDVRPPEAFVLLARKLDLRMRAVNEGRLWVGGHMRRSDFTQLGWVMEGSLQNHLSRIKDRLKISLRDYIRPIRKVGVIVPYHVPGVVPNRDILEVSPPLENDKIFIVSDTEDPTTVAFFHGNGAVVLADLLQPSDRRALGPLAHWLTIRDVQAVLEHELVARATFYYGHAMTAVGGVVLEARARLGWDERLALID